MLTDVPVVDQNQMKKLFRFGISSGQNILVLGPSGGGKTFIAMQVAKSLGCRLIYVNLSVLERTDFQGLPVVSNDKSLVSYATPDFLPFADVKTRDESMVLETLYNMCSDKNSDDANILRQKMVNLQQLKSCVFLNNHISFIKNLSLSDKFVNMVESVALAEDNDLPIVFLFDEVDKAAHEVLQTLLEFLQLHSVNGRKLKIKSCILTGNLPDEFANSAQISHAITKRGLTFKLQLDFNQWREWAYANNVHPQIIGFLTANPDYLHRGPPDNDPTAYALPSPRTWTSASDGLWALNNDKFFSEMRYEEAQEFRIKIVAGNVGDTTAIKFNNWLKFYNEMDPYVENLLENGVFPDANKKLDTQQLFVCALSACSKAYTDLRPNNEEVILKHYKNVYKWLVTQPPDVQMGAARMAFGGDFENIRKYKLAEIPEFTKVFKKLKEITTEWSK